MGQIRKLNPSYNELKNTNPGAFTQVVHVPELPKASGSYSTTVFYLQNDACFYRCRVIDGEWTWERVTYGTFRLYVLGVTWIPAPYTFNDEVNTIKAIISEMRRYGDSFEPMEEDETTGVTLVTAIRKANEIIKYVNRVCHSNVPFADEGTLSLTPGEGTGGETCESFATILNLLIGVLNPHAGFRKEIEDIRSLIGATPSPGESTEVTLVEFNLLKRAVAEITQWKADNQSADDNRTARITALEETVGTYSDKIGSYDAAIDTIIKQYIGWDKRGNNDTNLVERITSVETQLSQISGGQATALEALSRRVDANANSLALQEARVASAEQSVARFNERLDEEIDRSKERDEIHDAIVAKSAKIETAIKAIGQLTLGEDMNFDELKAVVANIIGICAEATATEEGE